MSTTWYVRRGAAVRGPFPRELIVRLAAQGVALADDEVSADRAEWRPLAAALEEIGAPPPPAAADPTGAGDPSVTGRYLRLAAARRERRGPILAAVAAVSVLVVFLGIRLTPPPDREVVQCASAPAPGIDWHGCHAAHAQLAGVDLSGANANGIELRGARLSGARLSHADLDYSDLRDADLYQADLRGASLVGADLRGANLSGADLGGANLGYADLGDARIGGASIADTRLGHTIWIDGSTCAADSLGACKR